MDFYQFCPLIPIIGDSKFRVPTETGKPGMKIVMEHEKLVKSHGFLPISGLEINVSPSAIGW